MREFISPRRYGNPPPESPFNNAQTKDNDLSAIMARRRQISDTGVKDNDERSKSSSGNKNQKTFSPRSKRMSTMLSTETTNELSPKPKNELQMAMSKRRTKVEDTSIPIFSPRQQMRTEKLKQVPMAPMLQDKLQKQRMMVEQDIIPPSASSTAVLSPRNQKVSSTATSTKDPNSITSAAIPDDFVEEIPSKRTSMGTFVNDSSDHDASQRHASFNDHRENNPQNQVNQNDESSSDDSVSHSSKNSYHDTDDENMMNGGNISSDDGGYVYESNDDDDNSTKELPSYMPQRRQERRAARRHPPKTQPNNIDQEDVSGHTFQDEPIQRGKQNKQIQESYPIASDTEDDDPFTTPHIIQNDSFHRPSPPDMVSDSGSDSNHVQQSDVEDDNDEQHSDSEEDNENHTSDDEHDDDDEEEDQDDEGASYDGENTIDDDVMSNDQQTIFDVEPMDNTNFGPPQQFKDMDDATYNKEVLSHPFDTPKDVRGYNEETLSNPFDAPKDIRGFSDKYSVVSVNDMSLQNQENNNINADVFGGKIVDGQVVRDIPSGDESDHDSTTSKENLTDGKREGKKYYTRVCSWPCIICIILIGSIAAGIGIGIIFRNGSSDSSDPVVPDTNTTTSNSTDPTRETIPMEYIPIYDTICAEIVDCSILVNFETAQGQAFDWLIYNKTANPSINEMSESMVILRYALATIYYGTGGNSWVNNKNWLSNETECSWYTTAESGSGCGIEGQTTFSILELDFNNLKGELPYELSLIPTLTKISIRNPVGTEQYLRGTLPSTIGKLTSLISLSLSGNQFSSGVPAELGYCTSLEFMDLSDNGLNGDIPSSLKSLQNLTALNLEGNFFPGILDPDIFDGAKYLTDLNLARNRFTGIPDTIMNLQQLQILNLRSNSLTTVPLAITQLTRLNSLDLSENSIKGSIPVQFGRMTMLRSLDISKNQLTGIIPVELGKLVMMETELDLSFNKLKGQIPSQLGQLTQLRRLRFDNNRLTGNIPTEISKLNLIEEIRFEANDLTGTVPIEVCAMFNEQQPASSADCTELQNATCITTCCSKDKGCVCQFELSDPLLCIKNPQ